MIIINNNLAGVHSFYNNNKIQNTKIKLRLVFIVLTFCQTAFSQPNMMPNLERGKYSVGFSSVIKFDDTQNYPFYLDSGVQSEKLPKPILINIWYPAEYQLGASMMKWKNYFDFSSKEKNIKNWVKEYKIYCEQGIVRELLNKEPKDMDVTDERIIDSFLAASTTVVRNARQSKGKFPFIIYAQGAGGTIEDNAIFCELLASHGYIVFGSSFQYNEASSLAPQSPPGSTRDIVFLLNYIRHFPGVDYQKGGMIGHSLGAQKMISFMAQGSTPFDALVSLETTQEYHSLENKLWDYYVADATRNANAVTGSFFFATNPTAIHVLADRFVSADRYYFSFPGLSHNDYISQGIQKRYIAAQKKGINSLYDEYHKVANRYAEVCNAVVVFFNRKLKGDSLQWNSLRNQVNRNSFGKGISIEHMSIGQSSYSTNLSGLEPPTPRQMKFLILDGKIDTATQLLESYWTKDSLAPVYDPSVAYALILHLLAVDTRKALQVYKVYGKLIGEKDIDELFIFWARITELRFSTQEAKKLHDALYLLNPDNPEKVKHLIDLTSKK
jgi:hypothetical protein